LKTLNLRIYSNRDNLNISHNANSKVLSAALVIGRKRLGFQEKTIVSVRGLKHPRGDNRNCFNAD